MHDVIVIGGSFAGLAAATQLARARRNVLVLDSGAPRNRNARRAHGFLAHDGDPPRQILETARRQLLGYPTARIELAEVVGARRRDDECFAVETTDGRSFESLRLILAHGVADVLDTIPGLHECWGRTVLHCPYCHAYEVAGRRLGLLLRHGDTLRLARLYRDWSADLTLFCDGAPLDRDVRDEVTTLGVRLIESAVLKLDHEDGDLSAVVTAEDIVPLDALFAHPPFDFASPVGVDLGCAVVELAAGRVFDVTSLHETSVGGVFAAGDCARTSHNISVAVGDGAGAGICCHQSLMAD